MVVGSVVGGFNKTLFKKRDYVRFTYILPNDCHVLPNKLSKDVSIRRKVKKQPLSGFSNRVGISKTQGFSLS